MYVCVCVGVTDRFRELYTQTDACLEQVYNGDILLGERQELNNGENSGCLMSVCLFVCVCMTVCVCGVCVCVGLCMYVCMYVCMYGKNRAY